ncbi:hypothetical protein L208DRAFT_790544 [Tricholoma matsutake]|nr:hypothetical protein L208DRAFT_790544 [Tricholoma matsutake 945]
MVESWAWGCVPLRATCLPTAPLYTTLAGLSRALVSGFRSTETRPSHISKISPRRLCCGAGTVNKSHILHTPRTSLLSITKGKRSTQALRNETPYTELEQRHRPRHEYVLFPCPAIL